MAAEVVADGVADRIAEEDAEREMEVFLEAHVMSDDSFASIGAAGEGSEDDNNDDGGPIAPAAQSRDGAPADPSRSSDHPQAARVRPLRPQQVAAFEIIARRYSFSFIYIGNADVVG